MTRTQQERPQWTNSYAHVTGTVFGGATTITADSWLPDPGARDIELPAVSVLFGHLEQTARSGGILYLTRFGRRVAAVVPADVAESFEQAEADHEPGAGLRELLRDAQERLGPVPPEVAAEVDRQWDAALASM